MSELNPGTPSPAEQVPSGPQPTEQAPSQTQQPGAPVEQPASAQPTAEQLNAQLNQERAQREQLESNYKSLQGEFTRRSQALAQLTGATGVAPVPAAPPDPLQRYVEMYTAQGFDAKQARMAAQVQHQMAQDMIAPIQQQVQVAQQASGIDYAIQQAAGMAPHLFSTQEDVDVARQAGMAHLRNGGQLDPRFLVSVSNDNRLWKSLNNPTPQPTPTPQAQPPNPLAGGMFRVTPGLTPQFPIAQKPQGAQTTEGKALEQYLANALKPK